MMEKGDQPGGAGKEVRTIEELAEMIEMPRGYFIFIVIIYSRPSSG